MSAEVSGIKLRVSLDGGEKYQLVDEQSGPVAEVDKFLRSLEVKGRSPLTVRAYAYDLLTLYRWLKQTGKQLHALQADDLLAFIDAQRKDGAHPRSINRRLSTCRQLYCFCTDREVDSMSGASLPVSCFRSRGRDHDLGIHRLKKPQRRKLRVKAPRKLVEPLTREQVRLFLGTLRRYRDLAITYLMLLCGLRSREVLNMQLDDVDFEEHRLLVRGKGDKQRMLPLPDILWKTICSYLRYERPKCPGILFLVMQGRQRGKSMTPDGLRSLFRHRRREPAIANANAHRWRHTFGTDMARSGVRLPILQKMMGHAHARTALQYINLSMADIADEYKRAIEQIQQRYEPDEPGPG